MEKVTPIPSHFQGIRSLADKSLRCTFDTQELGEDFAADLIKKCHKHGYLIFLENEVKVDLDGLDIPEAAPEFKGEKTPGQRLRAVLYILWQQSGNVGTFQDFYIGKMEEITNHFKAKLI
jgi:hypothetical protein